MTIKEILKFLNQFYDLHELRVKDKDTRERYRIVGVEEDEDGIFLLIEEQ